MTKSLFFELCLLLLAIFLFETQCHSKIIEDQIIELTKLGEVDPLLFVAIARQESSLRPYVTGDKGNAYGLFQVHLSAANEVGFWGTPKSLFDPGINIVIGVSYFYYIYRKLKKNLPCTISAYNKGRNHRSIGADKNCTHHKYYVKIAKKYDCIKQRGIYADCGN